MARCAACGFLSVRNHDSGELHDVDQHYRETGDAGNQSYPGPVCFVSASSLDQEVREKAPAGEANKILWVVQRERPCDKEFGWVPGLSPKEHLQRKHAMDLLRMQEEIRERDRQWQSEEKVRDRRWNLKVSLISGAAGAAVGSIITAVVAAVVAAMTKWWH